MEYPHSPKFLRTLIIVIATLALLLLIVYPKVLWVSIICFAGHLCIGIYRGLIKPLIPASLNLRLVRG